MQAKDGVEVRPASWRDLRPVLRLERMCFQADAWPWIDVLAALTFPETVRYVAEVPADRAAGEYTPRVVAAHPEAIIPAEAHGIRWFAR